MLFVLPLLAFTMASCSDDDNGSSLSAVTDVTYEPTMGGAIIKFKAPESNDLLYIKAVYTNSLGNEVYNITSIYNSQIEIEGLNDENKIYPVRLYAIDKEGKSSPVANIDVSPSRSYINIIADSLKITPIVGGIELQWYNPVGSDTITQENPGKTVYVDVTYTDPDGKEQTRFVASQNKNVKVKMRGLEPGQYTFTYQVEDFQGNKTDVSQPITRTVSEEVIIPKYFEDADGYRTYVWTLVDSLTTLKEVYENRNAAIFDGVVDDKDKADDNSYAGTNGAQYGGNGTLPWGTNQLDIVVDLHQVVNISRVRAWQRAHFYGWSPYAQDWRTDGTSYDYDYYQSDNLKRFAVYGSMDAQNWFLIQDCDIAKNSTGGALPQFATREEAWNGHTGVWMPTQQSYNYALDGHLWELDNMSPDTRYIRVRFLENWDMSKRTVSGLSELTLYGGIIKPYTEIMGDVKTKRAKVKK